MLLELGTQHNLWTIVSYYGKRGGNHSYNVVCQCGKTSIVSGYELATGKSSGCKACRHIKHGLSRSRLYRIWNLMNCRCYKLNNQQYQNYGGRGIQTCEEWKKPDPFLEWALSHGYQDDLELDRIDNNGPYCPENCRWVSKKENNRNKRTNRLVTAFGETKCFVEWFEDPRCRVSKRCLRSRLDYGWNPEDALVVPTQFNSRWHQLPEL